jgi:NAD+ kinase
MLVAIHGRPFKEDNNIRVQQLFHELFKHKVSVIINESFYAFLVGKHIDIPHNLPTFNSINDIYSNSAIDLFISVGGDGTLLETVTFIGDLEIPILGINTGRLGFLATTPREEIEWAVEDLIKGNFKITERSLIRLISDQNLFENKNYALNEFAIMKRDSSSMITIHTYIDGEFLNSYWGDGLVISTPTGSTGYSLSCGGPLVHPKSETFIIAPISPHNLNMRPLIVPNTSQLSFEIEGRDNNYLLSLDSRSKIVSSNIKLGIKKEEFTVKLVELRNYNYYKTLRNKLNWGLDTRN